MTNFDDVKQDECLLKAIPKGVKLNNNRTIILQSVINEIKVHGRSSMNKEVCGVLIGNLCWDKGAYLLIDARIEGKFADHQSGSVTFTSETWDFIHQELSDKYPDKKIVGWYHTHPGFGIFLSNMDVFIHENFFGIKWQPAYVYDPQAETEGFFFWKEANLEQDKISIVPNEPAIAAKEPVKCGEKISVIITDEDEKENNRRRLSYAAFTIIFLILGLSCGLSLFFLHKKNQQLEQTEKALKEKESQYIQIKIEQGEFDSDRNTKDAQRKKKITDLQQDIVQKELDIARLKEEIDRLKTELKKSRTTIESGNRKIQSLEAKLKKTELELRSSKKQYDDLTKQNSAGKKKPDPSHTSGTGAASTKAQQGGEQKIQKSPADSPKTISPTKQPAKTIPSSPDSAKGGSVWDSKWFFWNWNWNCREWF